MSDANTARTMALRPPRFVDERFDALVDLLRVRALERGVSPDAICVVGSEPLNVIGARRCADLDYVAGEGRAAQMEYAMSNNFAFGGVNTSLVFRRA